MQSTLPPSNRPKRHLNLGSYLSVILTLGISAFIWLNHQYLSDTVNFWRYKPTPAIMQISSRAMLTDEGKFTFYAVEPSLDGTSAFNDKCERKESGTAILGCYTDNRIYIYDVTDSKLDGIKEVTAAHELLHAVYERMSQSDRDKINKLVEAEYAKLQKDPDFAERMAFYARTEPGERDNELHSIIGTEMRDISPELESHYRKYFNDRARIVSYHESYDNAFTSLSNRAKELAAQLDSLSHQVAAASAKYNSDVKKLNKDITDFNYRAKHHGFSSQEQFDSERDALVVRTKEIDTERNTINTMVDQFNNIRNEYNSIVTQSNDLYKSIDSTLSPAPKV